MMTVITLILILATFSLPIYRTVVVRAQGERSPAISCRSGKAIHGQDGRIVQIMKSEA